MSHVLCPLSWDHVLFLQIEPYMPYEFTCEGMLQRINAFIEKQVRLFIVHLSCFPTGLSWTVNCSPCFSGYFLGFGRFQKLLITCWNFKACPVMVTQGSWSVLGLKMFFMMVKGQVETYNGRDWMVEMTNRPVFWLDSKEHHKDLSEERDDEMALWSCLMFISHPKNVKNWNQWFISIPLICIQ